VHQVRGGGGGHSAAASGRRQRRRCLWHRQFRQGASMQRHPGDFGLGFRVCALRGQVEVATVLVTECDAAAPCHLIDHTYLCPDQTWQLRENPVHHACLSASSMLCAWCRHLLTMDADVVLLALRRRALCSLRTSRGRGRRERPSMGACLRASPCRSPLCHSTSLRARRSKPHTSGRMKGGGGGGCGGAPCVNGLHVRCCV